MAAPYEVFLFYPNFQACLLMASPFILFISGRSELERKGIDWKKPLWESIKESIPLIYISERITPVKIVDLYIFFFAKTQLYSS